MPAFDIVVSSSLMADATCELLKCFPPGFSSLFLCFWRLLLFVVCYLVASSWLFVCLGPLFVGRLIPSLLFSMLVASCVRFLWPSTHARSLFVVVYALLSVLSGRGQIRFEGYAFCRYGLSSGRRWRLVVNLLRLEIGLAISRFCCSAFGF